jgi:diguanylate cyclase (GGDEF)-like protein
MFSAAQLEPRDRTAAARTAAVLTAVSAAVTFVFALAAPADGGEGARLVTFLVPAALLGLAGVTLHAPERRHVAVWVSTPILGILAIASLDLATHDASAAGQVFLCYPVVYAASQLRATAAGVAAAVAIAGDAVVVLTMLPRIQALTDLAYVSATLITMTILLAQAGQRHDRLVAELQQLAATDALTGLATRRVLDEAAQVALSSPKDRAGTALIMLDVDHFKSVNDAYGHGVGDAVLVHVARILSERMRRDTTICRIGGDEIAFLLPSCPQAVAIRRAAELVEAVRERPMTLPDGTLLRLSVSLGVAHAPEHASDLRELYAEADAALYQAKRAGRDRVGLPALVA